MTNVILDRIRVNHYIVYVDETRLPLNRERIMSNDLWKVAGAFDNPNGIQVYWKCPE